MSEALALADSVRNYRNKMTQLLGEIDALTTRAEEAEALLRRVNDEYKFYGDLLNETKENIKQHLTKTEAGNEV